MSFFSRHKEVIIFILCAVLLIIMIQTSFSGAGRVERETRTVKVKLMD